MKPAIPILAALLLAGCAVRPSVPRIETVTVYKPVAAPCVPANLGPSPQYIDSDDLLKAAKDAAERFARLWDGRKQRIAREQELEAALSACPKITK